MAATDARQPLVVCDAGPLIHLDEVACLDLLAGFSAVLVPQAVWQEVHRHRPAALTSPAVTFKRVQPPAILPAELEALSRVLGLHRGETEALAVATTHDGAVLLTDDTAARLAAESLGLPAHGSLGILVRAIRQGQRSQDEVLATLRALPSTSSLHLKRELLDEVIRQVEKG